MKCPNCHREMPDYAAYCSECGHPLRQLTCPHCGGQVSAGDRYCGMCGADLSLPNSELQQTETQSAEMRPEPVRTAEEAVQTVTKLEHTAEPAQTANKPGRKKNEKTRKRWKPVLIIAVCLILAAGGGFAAWWFLGSSNAQLLKATENYEEVNEALLAVTTADAYNDLTTEEKAEQVLEALTELADEGKVLADSVGYDESYPLVYYSYADGAYGGVMLEEFAEGVFGVGAGSYNTNIYKKDKGEWVFDPWPSVPSFSLGASPYENDLSALIVCDLGAGNEKYLEYAQSLNSGWNEAYLDTTLIEEGTLSFYRTGLSGYDLVVIWEHGEVYNGVYGEQPVLILQEIAGLVDDTSHSIGSFSDWRDLRDNRIGQVTDGTSYMYFLTPEFFSYYYGDGQLTDSVIWIGGCYGYYNDALVSTLAGCGAKAVLGATNSVVGSYDFLMLDAFAYMQLCGRTVDESLTFAEQIWGANDWIFAANREIPNAAEAAGAEIHWYNGGDETLVTLTAEAQEIAQQGIYSGTVVDAADSSVPIVGAVITVTNADGTVAETTTDETGAFEIKLYLGTYTVQIEMEGYQSVSSEVTVVAGESTDILISLSAEINDADLEDMYLEFLAEGNYPEEFLSLRDWAYSIYDINGDNVKDLILYGRYGSYTGIDEYYFYTWSENQITYIGNLENDPVGANGMMYYSAAMNAIAVIFRTSSDWYYHFYKINETIVENVSIGWTNTKIEDSDGKYIYLYSYRSADGTEKELTEAEYYAFENEFDDVAFTSFSDIE